jgi:hypothetical protein
MLGLVASAVPDRPLALGVGPAGAVGDQLAVVAHEQAADDLSERFQLSVCWLPQAGSDVMPESEVAAGRFGIAGAGLCPALPVGDWGVAQFRALFYWSG